jgi:hypothetical protein
MVVPRVHFPASHDVVLSILSRYSVLALSFCLSRIHNRTLQLTPENDLEGLCAPNVPLNNVQNRHSYLNSLDSGTISDERLSDYLYCGYLV